MLILSAFSFLYELVIGVNSSLSYDYRENVFSPTGLVTLVTTGGLCALFYLGLGRWRPIFHKLWHWWVTLSINSLCAFGYAHVTVSKEIGQVDGYGLNFASVNAIYSAVVFFLLSLLLKRVSIFPKHTPFKF